MSETATKQDILKLGKQLRSDMVGVRTELQADMSNIRSELQADMSSMRSELQTDIRNAVDDLTALLRTFMTQVDERFSRVEEEQHQIRLDINRLFDLCDRIIKKQEIADDERLLVGHQLERLDRWTHELAKKIGYTLQA